jgi:hypothetical protein
LLSLFFHLADFFRFATAAYSKWTEDELQRWLADHDITYPEKTDRSALENLIRQNWEQKSYRPYSEWEPAQMQQYLREKGIEIEDKAVDNKNWLLDTIKSNWHWTEATVEEAYANVKGWIFDRFVLFHPISFSQNFSLTVL